MSGNFYHYRNPNDKTSYVDRNVLVDNVNKRREWYKKYSKQQDSELLLFNSMYLVPQEKENLIVDIDGNFRDISRIRRPQYLSYDGNNRALWQGDNIVMSTSGLYRDIIDEQYKKSRDPEYIKSKRKTYHSIVAE